MKKGIRNTVTAFLFFIFATVSAQQPLYSFVLYDSIQYLEVRSVVKTTDHGYMMAGMVENGNSSGLLIKLDSSGNVLWKSSYSNPGVNPSLAFNNLIATKDSNFVAVGYTYDSAVVAQKIFLLKFDTNGDTLWSRAVDVPSSQGESFSVTQTFDDGYIVGSIVTDTITPYQNLMVTLFDSIGSLQWSNIYSSSVGAWRPMVRQMPDSGYIISVVPGLGGNTQLLKLFPTGVVDWCKEYNLASPSYPQGAAVEVSDSGLFVAFELGNGIVLLKADGAGNVLWSANSFWSSFIGIISNPVIQKTSDHGYVVLIGAGFDSGLLKIDSAETLLWLKDLQLIATGIVETDDHGFLITGNGPLWAVRSMSYVNFPSIGIIKTDSLCDGPDCIMQLTNPLIADTLVSNNVTITRIPEGTQVAGSILRAALTLNLDSGCVGRASGIKEISFDQSITVYPNPASEYLTLETIFSFSRNSFYQVYDLIGSKLMEQAISGKSVKIPLDELRPGIYCLVLHDKKGTVCRKIIKYE